MYQGNELAVRERLHAIVNKAEKNDTTAHIYNIFICVVAIVSLVPLMFREQTPMLVLLDTATIYILFLDYNLRWFTCDFDGPRKGWKAFVTYPFTPFALFDILSLLPSFGLLWQSFTLLRVLRFVKILRYSESFTCIANVIKEESKVLLSVLGIAVAYIFISALAMFSNQAEADTFHTFFDALYWATTALTTVGYGDIYPVSDIGRLISMVSSLFGIAIIALPAGIVTGGYIEQIHKSKAEKKNASLAPPPVHKLNRTMAFRFCLVLLLGVLMNELGYALGKELPLWLDMVGTCYASLVMGPLAGLIVGFANNAYLALSSMDNNAIVYYIASACAALMLGLLLSKKHQAPWRWQRVAWVSALTALATAFIGFMIRMLLHGGMPETVWEMKLYQSVVQIGGPGWLGCLYSITAIKLLDWAVSVPLLCILVSLTKRWERKHSE